MWRLAGENSTYIEEVLRQDHRTVLTTVAYLMDKAKQEKLEAERMKMSYRK